METERIALSQRERDRLKVLHEVKQKHLTQVAAAKRLKVTDRQVRRMLLRIRERGEGALVHGLRGQPSNRTQRFTVAPRHPRNAHRRLGQEHRLEEILSVGCARKVAQDHTVSWEGNRWGVSREEVCAGLRGAQVEIERRLDGSHWLRFRNRYLCLRHCAQPAPRAVSPSGLRPPVLTAKQQSRVYKSAPPNHPWRTFQYGRKQDISTLR